MATDIYNNKFVKKLFKNSEKIFKLYPLTAKELRDFRRNLQSRKRRRKVPYVQYNGDIFSDLSRVTETLEDLRAVQVFLRQYPYPKTLKKHKISRTGYAIYHIEVYFLKVASLREKLGIMVNDVYQLGLPDRRVTIDLLAEMPTLKGTRPITLLKHFSKSIEGIARQRHLVAHRGKYDDKELTELRLYELVQERAKIPDFLIRLKIRWYVREKLRIFKQNQDEIEKFIDIFFSSLVKEFDRRCKALPDPSTPAHRPGTS
ncbi:MAG: Cthe_2314 family HEPN domain-containing protein [Patescibacteria group bacterium]